MAETQIDKNEIETTDVNLFKQKKGKHGMLVGVISLGCDKNRVDTENMLTYFALCVIIGYVKK